MLHNELKGATNQKLTLMVNYKNLKKKKKITHSTCRSRQVSNKATPFLLPMCPQAPQLPFPDSLKSLKIQTKLVIPLGSLSVPLSFSFQLSLLQVRYRQQAKPGAVPTTS
jgi:hypothetical protein